MAPLPRKVWTRDEVAKLAEVFPDQRIELVEGVLFDKMEQEPPHERVMGTLNATLNSQCPGKVLLHAPVALPHPESIRSEPEPEPDLVLLHRTVADLEGHPRPEDVALAIEVSDCTLRFDREIKGCLYSRCGIAEYWIVDIAQRRVLVFREPGSTEYQTMKICSDGIISGPHGFSIALDQIFA